MKERLKKIDIEKFRGEGIAWIISALEIVLNSFEGVIKDAKDQNLSKKGASRNDIHIYKCKLKECPFQKKYSMIVPNEEY